MGPPVYYPPHWPTSICTNIWNPLKREDYRTWTKLWERYVDNTLMSSACIEQFDAFIQLVKEVENSEREDHDQKNQVMTNIWHGNHREYGPESLKSYESPGDTFEQEYTQVLILITYHFFCCSPRFDLLSELLTIISIDQLTPVTTISKFIHVYVYAIPPRCCACAQTYGIVLTSFFAFSRS